MKLNGSGIGIILLLVLLYVDGHSLHPASGDAHLNIPQRIVLKISPAVSVSRTGSRIHARASGLSSVDQIHAHHGIHSINTLMPQIDDRSPQGYLEHIWIIDVPAGASVEELLDAYRAVPEIAYAEEDRMLELFSSPDDSLYSLQWALNNTGQEHFNILRIDGPNNDLLTNSAGIPDADIDAEEILANPPAEATSVVVAIIDTGVDLMHPDLAGRLWINPNEIGGNQIDDDHNGFVDDTMGWDHSGDVFWIPLLSEGDPDPTDTHGHGTHCAGIVAAVVDNQMGIAGIAGSCVIMPIKIFPLALTSVAARAIIYAADNGADVINMSWGGPWHSQVLADAVRYALSKGVVMVAAAGNSGNDSPFYPAAYPDVITVTATNDSDVVTSYSSYGAHINIAAPGDAILSLRARNTDMYGASGEPNIHIVASDYYIASGTSMASPMVAGAAARLRAQSAGLLPRQVGVILEATADDLVDPIRSGDFLPGWDPFAGSGRLNLRRAVAAAPGDQAEISSPGIYEIVAGQVEVIGTAISDDGVEYRLEFGAGRAPTQWHSITTGSADLANDLLGIWQTASMEGTYSLRLTVGDSNAAYVTVYVVNSQQAEITTPGEGDTVTSWTPIIGTATDTDLVVYLVEVGAGREPDTWELLQQGTSPVVQDELSTWHAGDLPDGWYTIRLRLLASTGLIAADTVSFFVRSTFSTPRAWKIPLHVDEHALVATYGDFNVDGKNEIVVGTSDGIKFFDPGGYLKTSDIPDVSGVSGCQLPLAVGDVDGDGHDDLVAVSNSGVLWIYPSSEQSRSIALPKAPNLSSIYGVEEFRFGVVFLKDIDGDLRDEIHYYPGYSGPELSGYFIFNADGSPRLQLPLGLYASRNSFFEYLPADLNGDGLDELYTGSEWLFRLSSQGVKVDSVRVTDRSGNVAKIISLSAVDVNVDGRQELVAMAVGDSTHTVIVYDENLDVLPGWPHNTDIANFWSPSEPIFCDLDGDLSPEYFISWSDLYYGHISAWHSDGTPLSGHASSSIWTSSLDPALLRSPVATDVDADGSPDIIACATESALLSFSVERILAWNTQGQLLPQWPIITESGGPLAGSSQRYTTACGDIDRDGETDMMMVTSENNLVFVNIEGSVYDSTATGVEFWRYNRRLNNSQTASGLFRLVSINPTKLQAEVATSAHVLIGLSDDLDQASLTPDAIAITGSQSGTHTGLLSYDPARREIRFVSGTGYLQGETIHVTVSSNLRSTDGTRLQRGLTTSFRVGAAIPRAIATSPVDGAQNVTRDVAVVVTMNTGIDPATITDSSLRVTGNVAGPYAGTIGYDSQALQLTFTPVNQFLPAEQVTVVLAGGISSEAGIIMDEYQSWSFEIAWPEVVGTNPSPDAFGVPRTKSIAVLLDGSLPPFEVHDSTLVVYTASTGRVSGTTGYVASSNTAYFTPHAPFRLGEGVSVSVPGANYLWTFDVSTTGGDLNFGSPMVNASGSSPRMLISGDLNRDGAIDLIAARWPSPFVYLFVNDGTGLFYADSVLTGGTVRQTLTFDIDSDGDLDLVAVDEIGHTLALLEGDGAGGFGTPATISLPGVLTMSVADINGDGHLDLVSSAHEQARVILLLNAGGGAWSTPIAISTPSPPVVTLVHDVTGDGRADLICGQANGEVTVLVQDTRGAFIEQYGVATENPVVDMAVADFDNDGDADVLVLQSGNRLTMLVNDDGLMPDTVMILMSDAHSITIADLDADRHPDFILAGGMDSSVAIFMSDGTGGFKAPVTLFLGDAVWSTIIADLDSDGDFDLGAGCDISVRTLLRGVTSSIGDNPNAVLPTHFALDQNYPNPFNPATTINVAIPTAVAARLEVFNLLGRRVALLHDGILEPGIHSFTWDHSTGHEPPASSGVYFYRLTTDDFISTKKMLLLK